MGLEFPSLARSALNTRSTIAWKPFAIVVALALGLSACAGTASSAPPQGRPNPIELRLGYFPNLTYAPGLVGIGTGEFQRSLGTDVKLIPTVFKAGPAAVEGFSPVRSTLLSSDRIPQSTHSRKSNGDAIRIVSGSTSGGAALVVRTDIDKADDLRGATVASPQIGSTQDISLRGSGKWTHKWRHGGRGKSLWYPSPTARTSMPSGRVGSMEPGFQNHGRHDWYERPVVEFWSMSVTCGPMESGPRRYLW